MLAYTYIIELSFFISRIHIKVHFYSPMRQETLMASCMQNLYKQAFMYTKQNQQKSILIEVNMQRGFTHTLVRGKENVLGEVGLMFIGYNLSRCISIIGMEEFIKTLKKCCLTVFLTKIRPILRRFGCFLEKNVKLLPGKMKIFYTVKSFLFNPKDLYLYIN